MFKVVGKSDAKSRQIGESKKVINYISKEISPLVSLALMEVNDYFEEIKTDYDRIYFVTEGELILVCEGERVILGVNDACFLSKATEYSLQGTFKALVVNQPAFGS